MGSLSIMQASLLSVISLGCQLIPALIGKLNLIDNYMDYIIN